MRGLPVAVACTWLTGCVVYRDNNEPTWSSSSESTWVEPEGQVEVGWKIGSSGCEVAGVATIEVDLGGIVDTFDCVDDYATMTVPAGRYPLTVQGYDAGGVARYAGDGGTVQVRSDELTIASTVVLSGLPATVRATWYFDNGRLCSPNGVREVEVDLFDANDTLAASSSVACDDGRLRLDDVEAGAYVLVVLGRDADGSVVYSGESLVDAGHGDTLDLEVELVPE